MFSKGLLNFKIGAHDYCHIVSRHLKSIVLKDVYKLNSYKVPLINEDERNRILDLLNNAKSPQDLEACFAKTRASKVFAYKEELKRFDAIEQILDIRGIDSKTLERACKKFLQPVKEGGKKQQSVVNFKKRTVPSLEVNCDYPDDVVGFKFDLNGLSYAHIVDNKLKSFKAQEMSKPLVSKSAFEHHNLVQTSQNLADLLPKSPFYVYEEFSNILPRDSMLQIKMKCFLLEASLLATLNSTHPQSSFYSLKYNVVTSEFNARVGTERIMFGQQLEKVIDRHRHIDVEILPEQYQDIKTCSSSVELEQLSAALLTALAFRHTYISIVKWNKKMDEADSDSESNKKNQNGQE